MIILTVISGLLLTLHAYCQQNENSENKQNQGKNNTFVTDHANQTSDDPIWSILGQTQNGNDTGFIRKDSRNSDIFTVSRSDGHRTTFGTYEHKGFFAQTDFDRSQSTGNQFGNTRQPSIEGIPVPGIQTKNELIDTYLTPPSTPYPLIGGKPNSRLRPNLAKDNELMDTYFSPPKTPYPIIGGKPNVLQYNDITPNPNLRPRLWDQEEYAHQSTNSSPVYPVDTYSPYSYRNNSNSSSNYYAADPSIGGHPVELIHPNFESPLTQKLNQKLVSNWWVSSRVGVPRTDFEGDSVTEEEIGETKRLGWQVSVFSKEVTPYVRVCGGSIVTSTAVISAAQCFWGVGALPAQQFAVGAETQANPDTTADEYESYVQKIDVRDIKIPPSFRDMPSNKADIAVVLMEKPFYFAMPLQPVCVFFDYGLDKKQLAEGNQGTILGMSSTSTKSPVLLNHWVPVISVDQCLKEYADEYRRLVTKDKICAGVQSTPSNASICNHDIGSGLAFFLGRNPVPFLRGVASKPLYFSACSANGINTYTRVQSYMAFLLQHVPNIEQECWKHYPQIAMVLRDEAVASQSDLDDDDEVNREVDEEDEDGQFVCNCYC